FPPVHRVPIYVAGYRSPMMVVAGQQGDGYIARPAESIPGLRKLLRVMDRSAREAGRDPDTIDVAGYLLTLIDETRRDALTRAGLEAALLYGSAEVGSATERVALAAQKKKTLAQSARDRIGAWYEIARPFSFTASTVPVAAGGAVAAFTGLFDWTLFLVA